MYLVGLGMLIWHEAGVGIAWPDTAINIIRGMEAVVVVGATTTYALMEGASMLAERYIRMRYQKGLEEGRVEGRVEGREEGREEGLDRALTILEELQADLNGGSPDDIDLAKAFREWLEREREKSR